ncbi:MAG TPA: hypothetical protein VD969_11140 [Symbiobacteriaceae bacterium]|nr:hypothetical protein [Symbiobacteriaceae bacterium]
MRCSRVLAALLAVALLLAGCRAQAPSPVPPPPGPAPAEQRPAPPNPAPEPVHPAEPCVTPRWFAYTPATDEGHPFSGAQVCGLFTEGSADPVSGMMLLLWEQRPAEYGFEFAPILVRGVEERLPFTYSSLHPRFYGWLRHTDGFVFGGNQTVKAVSIDGQVLRDYPLPEGGALHGGAVSRRSGLVALFVSGLDAGVRLIVWNPETGEQTDYGAVAERKGVGGSEAFPYQWIDADWAPDDQQVAFTIAETLYLFDLSSKQQTKVASGYTRPRFSPANRTQILAETAENSVILDPAGRVLHNLPGHNWFWHLSGEALDRSAPAGANGRPPYDGWVTNYRLSDGRILQRGKGLVIGHAILPPANSRLVTLVTQ